MILTTTPTIEGGSISEYRGIVAGEAIVDADFYWDFFAIMKGFTTVAYKSAADRKKAIQDARDKAREEMSSAREQVFEEMSLAAAQLGGDAVVGVDLDYEVVGREARMLMVTASGTAVKTGPPRVWPA